MLVETINNFHNRLSLGLGKFFTTARKSILKLNCEVWWRNVVKHGRYSRVKFVDFVYICVTRGKSYDFCRENGNFFGA